MLSRSIRYLASSALFVVFSASIAAATCYPLAGLKPTLTPASFNANGAVRQIAKVPEHHLRIDFVGHSTFEIESPQGVRIATDYNDYTRPVRVPDIVTMNNSHDTHYSYDPDKAIKHVLRGWDPNGGLARHNVKYKDVRVRNVPTNMSEIGGKLTNGNSMFVIESVGMCVVHISHLHHVLSEDQLRDLGRIDIAFAPIDGMWTMSHIELFEVLEKIKPMLIIPMHFGSMGGVEAFMAQAKTRWPVKQHTGSTLELTFRDLPRKTEVLFLKGY